MTQTAVRRQREHVSPHVLITVNGHTRIVAESGRISYESLVGMVCTLRRTTVFTVTYRDKYVSKDVQQRQGSISPGEAVQLRPGMIFDVVITDNA